MMMRNIWVFGAAALLSVPALAATNLVSNGSFELTTNGPGHTYYGYTDAIGWNSNNGYNFIFAPGTIDTTGSYTPEYNGNLQLWGSHNGGTEVIPTSSPAGGNVIAADGAFQTAPIQQTLNGLTPGKSYAVSFYWAAGQQLGFSGPTTEGWQVSLGSQSFTTAIVANPSHGFTGWMQQTFVFTAQSSSDVLSFLALGTPEGLPPFSLLDGVTATAVPEASTWVMLVAGFGLVGIAARRRNRAVAA